MTNHISPDEPSFRPDSGRTSAPPGRSPGGAARSLAGFVGFVIVLTACFFKPLTAAARYALGSDLYSYTLLVPVLSVYLIWRRRKEQVRLSTSPGGALASLAVGGLGLSAFWWLTQTWPNLDQNDRLCVLLLSYFCFVASGAFCFFGKEAVWENRFAAAFLFLAVPMPTAVTDGLTIFLQHASTEVSYWLIQLTGTPVFRDGFIFQLPGLWLEVAEECSGIRSSLVLFIASLLAGHLFLRSPWKKALLAVLVVPLGVLRNALRITTLAVLAVQVDPGIMNSALHRRGGPLFFALSLIPLGLALVLLQRSERSEKGKGGGSGGADVS